MVCDFVNLRLDLVIYQYCLVRDLYCIFLNDLLVLYLGLVIIECIDWSCLF